jgi:anti-sigma regulatory factor (Ser/Thr protein kinase)
VTDTTSLSFPRDPDSVPAARAALARFHGKLPAATLYDASLCLSELVTNAIQHPAAEAGDEIELELSLSDDALHVKVIDPGGDFRPGTPTEGDERGWGLFIVDQLSTRWGTQPGARTVMWFEMAREEADPSRRAAGGRSEPGEPERGRRDEIASVVGRLRVKPVIQ